MTLVNKHYIYLSYLKEAIHKRMGTSKEKIETEWKSLRKRLNANFRSRQVNEKKAEIRKEQEATELEERESQNESNNESDTESSLSDDE